MAQAATHAAAVIATSRLQTRRRTFHPLSRTAYRATGPIRAPPPSHLRRTPHPERAPSPRLIPSAALVHASPSAAARASPRVRAPQLSAAQCRPIQARPRSAPCARRRLVPHLIPRAGLLRALRRAQAWRGPCAEPERGPGLALGADPARAIVSSAGAAVGRGTCAALMASRGGAWLVLGVGRRRDLCWGRARGLFSGFGEEVRGRFGRLLRLGGSGGGGRRGRGRSCGRGWRVARCSGPGRSSRRGCRGRGGRARGTCPPGA